MTGMRRGELLGLRWADVDLETERVNVAQVATMVGASVSYGEPKTRTSRRSIALDAGTVTALKAHRKRQLEERLAWGAAWADTGLVFTHEDGRALMPPHVTRMFGRLVAATGLPELTLHGLRHSHITALLRAGQPIRVVSARAGHSSPAITLGVYAHVLPGDDEAAALAAANALAEAKESRPRF
jgi:integrase